MRQGESAGQNCEIAPEDELLELLDELLLELLLDEEPLDDEVLVLELLLELLDDELLDEELLGDVAPPPQADNKTASVRARLPPRRS